MVIVAFIAVWTKVSTIEHGPFPNIRVAQVRAAVIALAALCQEPAAALQLPHVEAPSEKSSGGVRAPFTSGAGNVGEGSSSSSNTKISNDVVSLVRMLLDSQDGATRLAALRVYAHLCGQPSNMCAAIL